MFHMLRELRRRGRLRRGVSAVELAVCLPVLVMFGLGTIEATNAIFLKQRVTAAAYEGARAAIATGHTSSSGTAASARTLTQFGITGGSISATVSGGTGSITTSTTAGTAIAVTVTAPTSGNLCMPPWVVGNAISSVSSTVVMNHQ